MKKLLFAIPIALCLFACNEKDAEPEKMSATELSSEINETIENIKNSDVVHASINFEFMTYNYNIDTYIDYKNKASYMSMEYSGFIDVDGDDVLDSYTKKDETISKVDGNVAYEYSCETTTYTDKPSYNTVYETLTIDTYTEDEKQLDLSLLVVKEEQLTGFNYDVENKNGVITVTIPLDNLNLDELSEGVKIASGNDSMDMLSGCNLTGNFKVEINSNNIKINTENVNASVALQSGETVGSPTISMPINLSSVVEGSTDKSIFNIPVVSEENTIDFRE